MNIRGSIELGIQVYKIYIFREQAYPGLSASHESGLYVRAITVASSGPYERVIGPIEPESVDRVMRNVCIDYINDCKHQLDELLKDGEKPA